LTCMRLVNIDKDRSTTLPSLHICSPPLVSIPKSLDCRDQVFPSS
jgi:hypothetical protein